MQDEVSRLVYGFLDQYDTLPDTPVVTVPGRLIGDEASLFASPDEFRKELYKGLERPWLKERIAVKCFFIGTDYTEETHPWIINVRREALKADVWLFSTPQGQWYFRRKEFTDSQEYQVYETGGYDRLNPSVNLALIPSTDRYRQFITRGLEDYAMNFYREMGRKPHLYELRYQ